MNYEEFNLVARSGTKIATMRRRHDGIILLSGIGISNVDDMIEWLTMEKPFEVGDRVTMYGSITTYVVIGTYGDSAWVGVFDDPEGEVKPTGIIVNQKALKAAQ